MLMLVVPLTVPVVRVVAAVQLLLLTATRIVIMQIHSV